MGMAQNLESETVSVALLSNDNDIHEGSVVRRTGKVVFSEIQMLLDVLYFI